MKTKSSIKKSSPYPIWYVLDVVYSLVIVIYVGILIYLMVYSKEVLDGFG